MTAGLALAVVNHAPGALADLTVSEANLRHQQNHTMRLPPLPLRDGGTSASLWNFGFAYLKSTADVTSAPLVPLYAFQGQDVREVPRTIELSAVESFRLEKTYTLVFGASTAVVEVTYVPLPSPEELFGLQPSSRAPVIAPRQVVRMSMPLETRDGELYLVGRTADSPGYQVAVRLRDVALNQVVKVENQSAPKDLSARRNLSAPAARPETAGSGTR